jgi:hypothetical protein
MRKIKYDIMYMESEQYTDDFVGSKQKNILKQIENGIQSYCYIEEAGQIVHDKVSAPVKNKRKRNKKKIITKKRLEEKESEDTPQETKEDTPLETKEDTPQETKEDTPLETKEDTPQETKEDNTPEKEEEILSDLDELEEFDPEIED